MWISVEVKHYKIQMVILLFGTSFLGDILWYPFISTIYYFSVDCPLQFETSTIERMTDKVKLWIVNWILWEKEA